MRANYRLQTPIPNPKHRAAWQIGDGFLSLGSCFATHLVTDLNRHGFDISAGPFGMLYNALTLAQALERLVEGRLYTPDDIQNCDGHYFSWDHHGDYSGKDCDAVLSGINAAFARACTRLKGAKALILTLGTSYIYTLKGQERVVANCHRQNAGGFERRLASPARQAEALLTALNGVRRLNPEIQIVFTLSPIRHLRDAPEENLLSKGAARLAIQRVIEALPEAHYFPAYEILIDELRDYRFYAEDLIHPSKLAVQIIMDRFCQSHLSTQAQTLRGAMMKWMKGAEHRVRDVGSAAHNAHLDHLENKLNQLKKRHMDGDFEGANAILRALRAQAAG